MIRSPLTKLVLTLDRESECTSRGDIESRISFDFLRSRKLFPLWPADIRGNCYFPRINICNGVSREREREPSHPWLDRKKNTRMSLPPIFVFFLTIVNPSRWICHGRMLLNRLETYPYSRYRDIKDWKKITFEYTWRWIYTVDGWNRGATFGIY